MIIHESLAPAPGCGRFRRFRRFCFRLCFFNRLDNVIVRPKLRWFRMLFIWHGSVLGTVLPPLSFILLISILAVLWHTYLGDSLLHLNPVPFSLIGIALAIFLGFRNTVSYERFWEGRKLWGTLLNESRTLARQALTLTDLSETAGVSTDDVQRPRRFVLMVIAFAYCLKHQLRDSDDRSDLNRLLPPALADRVSAAQYRPAEIALMLGEELRSWRRDRVISDILAQAVDERLSTLSDVLGGCERLANTPIPYSYDVLLHRTVYFYCVLLPFGLVGSIGIATPIITVFIAYTFMALNAIASELEEPFGIDPNDLALDSMSRGIERSLREMLGERDLPPMTASRGGFWMT
jgi:putative membrane protein